ncbi:putative nuclease HARBI1 [Cucumis melo var. makuwa]|nr:putative nuclease HARBI1 [Cucumis melo var. makuwa]
MRKDKIATYVLGVYDTKGDFIFILADRKGSFTDSRILQDAISRPNDVRVPKGYYYLCDVGHLNAEGFLATYRGQRYHLQEWRGAGNAPTTSKEFFNMKFFHTEYKKGGVLPRGVNGGVGLRRWVEVRQWHVQTQLSVQLVRMMQRSCQDVPSKGPLLLTLGSRP